MISERPSAAERKEALPYSRENLDKLLSCKQLSNVYDFNSWNFITMFRLLELRWKKLEPKLIKMAEEHGE